VPGNISNYLIYNDFWYSCIQLLFSLIYRGINLCIYLYICVYSYVSKCSISGLATGATWEQFEVHLKMTIRSTYLYIWRTWLSRFGDVPREWDSAGLEMYLEAVIENVCWFHWWLHQQHVFQSLGASRSVGVDMKCKHRSINFSKVSVPRRAFWLALGVTGISDDWYRSTMGVIGISLGTCCSTGENFRCIWECCETNVGIRSKLWEMPGCLWIFIQRTAGMIWDAPDVHKQSISLNGEYDAWIVVHYHLRIILAIIFFNIVFFASLHWGTKEREEWTKQQHMYTETIIWLSDRMLSIKHGVNVIHSISHLIRADESRHRQFIHSANKLEVLLVFADYLYLVSGRNWIPM